MLITNFKFENEIYYASINKIIIVDEIEEVELIKTIEGKNLKGVCYRAHNYIEKYYNFSFDKEGKEAINSLYVKIAQMMIDDELSGNQSFNEELHDLNVQLENIYIYSGFRRFMDEYEMEELNNLYSEKEERITFKDIRNMIKDIVNM